MRYLFTLAIICFSFILQAEKTRYPYIFNSDLNEGISQLSVMDIFQDSKGYLWFATKNGLNRFNGKEYIIYRREDGNEQSLSNNSITSIAEDRNGNLWIGTGNGLNRIDLNTNRIKRYSVEINGAITNSIAAIYTDHSGHLWIGTWNGLSRYNSDNDSFESFSLDGELDNTAVATIFEDSTGKFWIGTRNKGVFLCDNQMNLISHFSTETKNMRINNNDITSIYEDAKKQIWIGSKYGLNRVDLRNNEILAFTSENSKLAK